MHVGYGLLALPISFLFVRCIEISTLRIRAEFLKAGSPAVHSVPWLARGLNLIGAIGLIYISRH